VSDEHVYLSTISEHILLLLSDLGGYFLAKKEEKKHKIGRVDWRQEELFICFCSLEAGYICILTKKGEK